MPVWDLSAATADAGSKDVSAQASVPMGLVVNADGTLVWVVDQSSRTVFEYGLSTPFDLSTATYGTVSFTPTQSFSPSDLWMRADGLRMWIVWTDSETVKQYNLSVAWDLSTATYGSKSFAVSAQDIDPEAVAFSSDGSRMFVAGNQNNSVYQYDLSVAWDVTTAVHAYTFSVSGESTVPRGLRFRDDGSRMFMIGGTRVYQYDLGTAWDLSTAVYNSVSLVLHSGAGSPSGLDISSDGSRLLWADFTSDRMWSFTLGSLRRGILVGSVAA